jgi:archaellum biogenesis protein FlaJ (TadC family)
MIRRIVLRAKRIQVASGIKALIYPLHVIECALLAFMTSLLIFLVNMVNLGTQFNSSIGLFSSSIEPGTIAPLFTGIMILMAIANAIALKVSEVSNNYRLFYHLSIMLMITGSVLIGVSFAVNILFKNMFNLQSWVGLGGGGS